MEDLSALSAEADLLEKIPIGYARNHLLLPCRGTDGSLVVLSGRPEATYALDEIRFLVGPAPLLPPPPPCRGTDGSLVVLSGRPEATYALDEIRFLVGPARVLPAPEDVILKKIDAADERYHAPEREMAEGLSGEWDLDVDAAFEETRDLLETPDEGPVIKF